VLADVVVHTVEDEANVEEDVVLSTFVSRLRSRKTMSTLTTSEFQAEEHKEEKHEEPPNNFSEPDVETLNDYEDQGIENPTLFEA